MQKYKQVKVNFYPEQYQILSNLAKEKNQTIAQFIRKKLDLNIDEKEVKKRYKTKAEKAMSKKDEMLVYEVNKSEIILIKLRIKSTQKKMILTLRIYCKVW